MLKQLVKIVSLLILSIAFLTILFYIFSFSNAKKIVDETKTVFIKKEKNSFKLYKNGNHFKMRGANGNSYLKLLSDIGGNTIRVYDTTNVKSILDNALKNNLAVIIDISIPKFTEENNYYSIKQNNIALKQNIRKLVRKHKDHPALLFWNLGNELDYPLVLIKNSFINTFNELIDIIHNEDPNHPVGTSLIPSRPQTLSIHLHSQNLDLIGFNAFGNLKMVKPLMEKMAIATNSLPYYISEYGSNGPWEESMTPWAVPIEQTSTKKGKQYAEQYTSHIITNKESMGDLVFFWGQKQEHTHTWFSIFDEKGRKSQVFYDVKQLWGNSVSKDEYPPQIDYMLINNQGAKERLVYNANDIKTAEIFIQNKKKTDTTYQYEWEVYAEGWNYNQTEKENRPKKIAISIKNKKDNSLTFQVPEKEGPYRLFVYVYDDKGNFATSNTPFYVLNK